MTVRVGVSASSGVLTLGLVLLATPALGYFTGGGGGTGSGAAGGMVPLHVLSASGSVSTPLYPGATGELVVTVQNPNASTVRIVRLAQGGGVSVTGGAGCTADPSWPTALGNSGVSVPQVTGLDVAVPGGVTQELRLPGAAVMSTASASGCQGRAFQIPITVEVRQ